jgi:predicted secreted protein
MTLGELAEVRLSAQLGTGYSWKWTDSGGFFEQAGSEKTVTSGEAKTGGRDTQVFLFRAVKPGEARLDFFYNQSWEASASPLKRFSVPVLIKPMGKN